VQTVIRAHLRIGGVVRITLDAETFKALASPTRLMVLRALDERRKTLTEISRNLSLNKATVHEHLQLLASAELVRKRDDEGRKWIYYELTWRGQKLLHPQETTTFSVLLGLGLLAAGGGIGMLVRALYLVLQQKAAQAPPTGSPLQPQTTSDTTGTDGAASPAASGSSSATSTSTPPPGTQKLALAPAAEHPGFFEEGGAVAVALLAAGLLFGLLSYLLRRKFRPGPFRPPPGMPPDRGL
jgi:DNA-binding transcriptional ArsR family regulator